jgi:predicted DNA-binding antitoxin AbrB/MazE fold protein
MAIILEEIYVYGVKKPLPTKGFPEGKIRFKLRVEEFALAYVKTPNGIREFFVKQSGGYWIPGPEIGANHREQIP